MAKLGEKTPIYLQIAGWALVISALLWMALAPAVATAGQLSGCSFGCACLTWVVSPGNPPPLIGRGFFAQNCCFGYSFQVSDAGKSATTQLTLQYKETSFTDWCQGVNEQWQQTKNNIYTGQNPLNDLNCFQTCSAP